ncbi:MAG: hypothetical protein WBQ85_14740, partial [Candidatus Sulfotelmatobacter sp.]
MKKVEVVPLNALALATDEYACHAMCGVAPLDQSRIRSVPTRVVGVMSRGAAFALVALPARSAVQHDL